MHACSHRASCVAFQSGCHPTHPSPFQTIYARVLSSRLFPAFELSYDLHPGYQIIVPRVDWSDAIDNRVEEEDEGKMGEEDDDEHTLDIDDTSQTLYTASAHVDNHGGGDGVMINAARARDELQELVRVALAETSRRRFDNLRARCLGKLNTRDDFMRRVDAPLREVAGGIPGFPLDMVVPQLRARDFELGVALYAAGIHCAGRVNALLRILPARDESEQFSVADLGKKIDQATQFVLKRAPPEKCHTHGVTPVVFLMQMRACSSSLPHTCQL